VSHRVPQKVIVFPPAQLVFEEPSLADAAGRELTSLDEQGAPTLGGLLWSADELRREARALCERLRADGLFASAAYELGLSLHNLAGAFLRHGCRVIRSELAPNTFELRLFRSAVLAAEALLSADGPLMGNEARSQLVPAAALARELLDAAAAAAEWAVRAAVRAKGVVTP
jgi:hypothetical protein